MDELLASLASDLVSGANIPFVAAFVLAVLFTVLSVIGLGHGDAEAEVEIEADADFDADADVDMDVEADLEVDADVDADMDLEADVDADLDHDVEVDVGAEADVDVDHDVDVDADAEVGTDHDLDHDVEAHAGHVAEAAAGITLNDILYFFGIGKVPLSILLMSFCYAFGLTGWMVNTLLVGGDGALGAWFSLSLLAALVDGLIMMRLVSSFIGKFIATKNVSGFVRRQLVGMRGVAGLPVSERVGRAQVLDPEGTRHQVRCRVVPGGQALAKGTKIIVVKYVAKEDVYYVAADRRR